MMRLTTVTMIAALAALPACNQPDQTPAENMADQLDREAERLDEIDNEAGADALENRADALRDSTDAQRNSMNATNATDGYGTGRPM